ncbi:MAG: glycoside hydrolase family 2 TIM barrel-domain containing protein [Sedimentisphaerales bacterium]|jgi:beta-galactosidase
MTGRISSLVVMAAAAFANGQTLQHPQNVFPVTDGWKFIRADVNGAEAVAFDDSKWSQVTLPHTWNDKDTLGGPNYYRGPGWYRIKLAIPETAKDKRVFIHFEAASLVADVYFNGARLGQHRGGFTAFCYELTPYIQRGGSNILAVRVDNSFFEDVPPLSGDFNICGGIYRPVWLIVKNQVCITPLDYASPGIYFKQTKVTKEEAIVDVEAKISNGLDKPVSAHLLALAGDANGVFPTAIRKRVNIVKIGAGKTVSLYDQLQITNPHLWNGRKDPYLYQAKVELLCDGNVVDEISGTLGAIGLRYFSVDANKGFFLNGESYPLHGVCRHQDRIGKGWAISYADQDEDANLILEMGANCVRLAHYPHSNYFISLCDKAGLVVWAEIPLVNQVYDTPAFAENAKQQLTELIRQKYNHPSIFFWSLYNELGNSGKCDDPRPLLTQLQSLAKQEDPTRLTTAASNDPSSKWPGLRAITGLIAWNSYPGWYRAMPTQMAKDIDKYKHDANDKPLGISEYGAGASIKQHEQNMKKVPTPGGKWHPEEWQAIVHEEDYAAIEARPYIWGSFAWVMFDFGSAGRNEGDAHGINDKGLVTADRKTRKDAFYFYKAKWTTVPFVYITSRRHTERTDPNTAVKVYSNCDSVELKVNGQTIGSQTEKNCVFKWFDIRLKPGLNTIEASVARDGKTYTDKCEWTLMPPVEPNKAGEPNK